VHRFLVSFQEARDNGQKETIFAHRRTDFSRVRRVRLDAIAVGRSPELECGPSGRRKAVTTSLAAGLTIAGILGITHAIEPDHVAGISALTSEYADSRLSMVAGACFALGHVGLVVCWVALGYLLLGQTSFPAAFETIGSVGVGILLGLLGAAMAVRGIRRVLHSHPHEHADRVHRHPHLHLLPGRDGHGHEHGVRQFLKTGAVGALFTLSPPLSMIAFASTLVPSYGPNAVALAVGVYAVAITGTMGLLGAGVGLAFGFLDELGDRPCAACQMLAGVGLAALSVSVLSGGFGGVF
jgi:hypothetical protein